MLVLIKNTTGQVVCPEIARPYTAGQSRLRLPIVTSETTRLASPAQQLLRKGTSTQHNKLPQGGGGKGNNAGRKNGQRNDALFHTTTSR